MKDLIYISLEEFQAMSEFDQDELFNEVVIVPTDDIHDSGYRCMKFVLCRKGRIVGCVGGCSDAIHPNWFRPIPTMSIDCLPVRRSPYVIGLLHDVCKINNYVFDVESNCWKYNPNFEQTDAHGSLSVKMIEEHDFKLTDEEKACILFHMGTWTKDCGDMTYSQAIEQYHNYPESLSYILGVNSYWTNLPEPPESEDTE